VKETRSKILSTFDQFDLTDRACVVSVHEDTMSVPDSYSLNTADVPLSNTQTNKLSPSMIISSRRCKRNELVFTVGSRNNDTIINYDNNPAMQTLLLNLYIRQTLR